MEAQTDLYIRRIQSYDEYIAVAELQKIVWGQESIEIVPPSILMVNQKIGGIVAGAFTPDHELVAFVYGLPGFRNNAEVHWSHMLAVKPAWRGKGIGKRLKQYQRAFVQERGIKIIHWTYDPLESVNAFLNLERLGAMPSEYICDLYGKGEKSILHKGIGTDRFILTWYLNPVDGQARRARFSPLAAPRSLPAVISKTLSFLPVSASGVRIEIPRNIQQLKREQPEEARAWRNATRAAFMHYFGKGYGVVGFHTLDEGCYYIMAQPNPS
ncbi:MAG: GNAT family N-acetyltransferase [Bacteroidota bacterium]